MAKFTTGEALARHRKVTVWPRVTVALGLNVVALVPEFVQKNATGNMSFLELDMPVPPMFVLAAGYLTSNLNPALHLALDVLRDSRIPLDY